MRFDLCQSYIRQLPRYIVFDLRNMLISDKEASMDLCSPLKVRVLFNGIQNNMRSVTITAMVSGRNMLAQQESMIHKMRGNILLAGKKIEQSHIELDRDESSMQRHIWAI
jgi:hypothetical protein